MAGHVAPDDQGTPERGPEDVQRLSRHPMLGLVAKATGSYRQVAPPPPSARTSRRFGCPLSINTRRPLRPLAQLLISSSDGARRQRPRNVLEHTRTGERNGLTHPKR